MSLLIPPSRFLGDEVRLGERRQRYVGPQHLPGFRAPRPTDLGTHPARVLLGSGLAGEGKLDRLYSSVTRLMSLVCLYLPRSSKPLGRG